ncbi:MAG: hypothetical protein GXP33_09870 [Spirochaetes bacterium]|nr:hypothetical protein [Spirochaetota bacterium]
MMVENSVINNITNNIQNNSLPVIRARDIKSILYLGIRGKVNLSIDHNSKDHMVDTFA